MRLARAFFALLAALANLAACSGKSADPQGPAVVNPGSTLTFTPSAVYANRFASVCGVPSPPPYGPGDVFSQLAVGAGSPGPLTGFGVDMEQAVAPGTTYDLIPVAPVSVQNPNGTDRSQNALASDGVLSFQFQWSPSNPGEIRSEPPRPRHRHHHRLSVGRRRADDGPLRPPLHRPADPRRHHLGRHATGRGGLRRRVNLALRPAGVARVSERSAPSTPRASPCSPARAGFSPAFTEESFPGPRSPRRHSGALGSSPCLESRPSRRRSAIRTIVGSSITLGFIPCPRAA